MNARYDDVIVALSHHRLDRAIELIEQMKAQDAIKETFELKPTEKEPLEFNKTTDFLNFHGWEAA